jgi:hypothetical protein
MASAKQYGYYIKGNKLAIVEKDVAFDNDPNSKDYGPGAEHSQWKSPLSSIISGIELEYTFVDGPDTISDENYELKVPNYLNRALIFYFKARALEDAGEMQQAEYYLLKFRKHVEQFNNSRITGIRIIASGPHAIR